MIGSTQGAWKMAKGDETVMLLVSENYFMQTTYAPTRFVSTRGGIWKQDGNKVTTTLEFDSADSTNVGKTNTAELASGNNQLAIIMPGGQQVFTRVDEVSDQTPMASLWRITARANNNGVVSPMQRGARKTLKLLTGSRFQWAAINPETKQFSGTGGGTYTLMEVGPAHRKYTETIDFFSRDNSRVGKSLTFDNKLNGDDWLHIGLSSTGGKVSEVWSKEK
ncbi:MAG: membrane or secreted protein [Rudanella sp.]|nr:membrane or secreted protein [Rudanella sp.]